MNLQDQYMLQSLTSSARFPFLLSSYLLIRLPQRADQFASDTPLKWWLECERLNNLICLELDLNRRLLGPSENEKDCSTTWPLVEGENIKFTWRLQVFRPFILKVFHACNYKNSPSTYFTHFIIFTIFWQIMSCKHIRCFLFIHWHYFAIKLRLLSVCEKKNTLSLCLI